MIPGLAELRGYRRAWLAGDLLAGVTVAAYLVPQVMAYATIAGLPPVTGLWAAVPALIVYVLFGSSKSLSMGPEATTALMTVVAIKPLAAGDPARYAELASTLALLTGLMAVAAGPAAGGAARHGRRGGVPPGRGRRRRAGPGPAADGAAARPPPQSLRELLLPAFTVLIVGFSDDVVTARSFARRGEEIVANRELLALGVANAASALVHGFPVSSSGTRTAIAVTVGNKTRAYSLAVAAAVLAVLLLAHSVLSRIPTAALGGIVIFAAIQLIDVTAFRRLSPSAAPNC